MELLEWKKAVEELNTQFSELDDSRDKIYEWMAEQIKDVFFKYLNYTPSIHFTSDAHLIVVKVPDEAIVDKIFSPKMFEEIGMKFTIGHEFDDKANYCLLLRYYPFDEV
jgi:hypothetical protein